MSEDFDFDALKAEIAEDRANEILDRHLDRTRMWIAAHQVKPTMLDLITKLDQEQGKRRPTLAAYGAALWRLIHSEGK